MEEGCEAYGAVEGKGTCGQANDQKYTSRRLVDHGDGAGGARERGGGGLGKLRFGSKCGSSMRREWLVLLCTKRGGDAHEVMPLWIQRQMGEGHL
jgi:hypothetical protein